MPGDLTENWKVKQEEAYSERPICCFSDAAVLAEPLPHRLSSNVADDCKWSRTGTQKLWPTSPLSERIWLLHLYNWRQCFLGMLSFRLKILNNYKDKQNNLCFHCPTTAWNGNSKEQILKPARVKIHTQLYMKSHKGLSGPEKLQK